MAGRSLNPYVEEYYSSDENDNGGVETLRTSPGQGQPGANVSMKRSHPSDLGADKTPPSKTVNPNIDLQSDSGYSSHTAATMSSADSAPSATSRSPPAAPATAAAPLPTPPSPALKKRPPMDDRKSSGSPRKPLQRTSSVSSRNRRPTVTTRDEECTDPKCKDCAPSTRGRRQKPSPLDSGLDVSYAPFVSDTRSQYSDPAPRTRTSYVSPQSPTYNTRPYMAGPAVITPAQTQSRRRSSSTTRSARPTSFHEGQAQAYYMNGGIPTGYPSPPQEIPQHGPPPASSAYHAMQYPPMNTYGMIGATPPNGYFHPPHPMQISPPYDVHQQRPPMPSRNTTNNFNTRARPSSLYGPPLVTQNINTSTKGELPSARYPSKNPVSAREARHQPQYDDDDDDSSDSYNSAEEYQRTDRRNDRALMPPPQIVPQRRGSLRQTQADQVAKAERRLSRSLVIDQSDPRASRVSHAPSRSTSVSRRPAYSKTQSYDTGQAHVMVENPRASRRQSVAYELEHQPREKMYRSDSVNHRRRKTDVDVRQRDGNPGKLRDTTNDIEAYLQKTRGSATPLNDHVHKIAKQRASRPPSGPSNSGSSHSKGSDKASRVSKVTSTGNGEIRLRVDANAPLNLQFNGDMEGRNIQINPVEGGMADIVIGNARGSENAYRSERGSVSGRKTVVSERREPRRDAEEHSSVKSRSSGQSRRVRDEERRPLRRKDHIQYNQ